MQQKTRVAVRLVVAVSLAASLTGGASTALAKKPRKLAVTASTYVVDGVVADWKGTSTLLSGTTQVSSGEFIYQDHIFDDFGASGGLGAEQRSEVAGKTKGTARYPTDEDRYANNVADLFQLRLAADATTVFGLVRLDALRQPDTTVTAIAFDVDGDLTDTAGTWPRNAGIATPGADRVVTIWAEPGGAGRGEVADLVTGTTTAIASVAVNTDDANNAYEFSLPRALLGGSSWRMWAGTGLWDGTGWMAVAPTAPTATAAGNGNPQASARLFNVAFRDRETGQYFDELQAAALATGDISSFSATFTPGASDTAYAVETGRTYAALVDEGFTIPPLHEGASFTGVNGRANGGGGPYAQAFDFFGRWQPYGLYLPQAWTPTEKWPTMFALHGRGGTHASYFDFGGGFQRDIGEGDGSDPMVIVAPLGRGRSHYDSWGEGDMLAVLDDATSRFGIDTDRISLGGYSMGGLGLYRLAVTQPDRWASTVAWAAASSEYTGGTDIGQGNHEPYGNFVQLMANVEHLPMLLQTGTNDEMLPITGQIQPYTSLQDLGYRYRIDLFAGYGHLSFGVFDEWSTAREWIGTRTRATNPRSFTYVYSPSIADPNTSAALGINYGKVWWVDDLARRVGDPSDPEDPYTYGTITVKSHAISEPEHATVRTYDAPLTPHPRVRVGLDWMLLPAMPTTNRLDVSLANLAAASIDVAQAQLTAAHLRVDLATDGPGVLHLKGGFTLPPLVTGPATVTIDGTGAHITATGAGAITLTFP